MLDLVGNHEDGFSCDAAHIEKGLIMPSLCYVGLETEQFIAITYLFSC